MVHSAFNSEVFAIAVGSSKTIFYVHADVLAKSEMLAKEVSGSWKENEEKKIEWPDWDVDAVGKFVEWLYSGDYRCPYPFKDTASMDLPSPDLPPPDPPPEDLNDWPVPEVLEIATEPPSADTWDSNVAYGSSKKKKKALQWEWKLSTPQISWSPKPLSGLTWSGCRDLAHMTQAEEFDKWSGHLLWKASELDYGATFMTHAQLYVMACFYMLPELKNMAWQRLRSVLDTIGSPANDWKVLENLGELIRYAYTETESHDGEPLRMLVTTFTALHFPRIKGHVIDQLILSEAHSDKEFVVDLMTNLTQQLGELKSLAGKS